MASPEQGAGRPEESSRHETEPIPYQRAAQFAEERLAGLAYQQARDAIYADPANDLSIYRFQLDHGWHVAALGELPPPALAQTLETILAMGTPAALPAEVLTLLARRRAEQRQFGPWVERRHRPGKRL